MRFGIAALLVVFAASAVAHDHGQGHPAYAGWQEREVKALDEQQLKDLWAGRGMGFALSAELNGYPGPSHVLELADPLHLTAEQRSRLQRLNDAMKAEAITLGETMIAQEKALDREFAERRMTPGTLGDLTAQSAQTQGQLRAVHLKYHLITAELLTKDQLRTYSELRGYQ
jgi:hypothetical protein